MRDHAKLQQREIAKKRLEAGYKRDKMEAISSADYEPKEVPKEDSPTKFTEMLNNTAASNEKSGGTKASTSAAATKTKNSF